MTLRLLRTQLAHVHRVRVPAMLTPSDGVRNPSPDTAMVVGGHGVLMTAVW